MVDKRILGRTDMSTKERRRFLEEQCLKAEKHEYLYHVTTMQALKSIIKHNQIWLSNLSSVNDMEEKARIDWKEYIDSTYVFCTTYDKELSPHHWDEYGNKADGVIIGIKNGKFWENDIVFLDENNKPILDEKYIVNKNMDIIPIKSSFYIHSLKLVEVSYEGISEKSKIVEKQDGGMFVFPGLAAVTKSREGISVKTHKPREWWTEKEVRLVIVISNRLSKNDVWYPKRIAVKLNKSFWDSMQIRFSPSMSNEKKRECKSELVELLTGYDVTIE